MQPPKIILHRPIPVRVAEEFYEQVEALPFVQVQAALRASHEWHVKYTGNQANPSSTTAAATTAAMLWLDREGAKNPSPCHSSGTTEVVLHQQQLPHSPNAKRLRDSFPLEGRAMEDEDEPSDGVMAAAPVVGAIQRPVAMRVTAIVHRIPRHICENAQNQRLSSMSPISLGSSSCCSSACSPSPLLGQTFEIRTRRHHPAMIECDEEDYHHHPVNTATQIQQARDGLLHALAIAGGDTDSDAFRNCLSILQEHYSSEIMYTTTSTTGSSCTNTTTTATTSAAQQAEGMWLTLTKPNFFDCLSDNDQGDPMYTLSRMSFNMFSPANLICSLQGNFNSVELLVNDGERTMPVPKSLSDAVLGSAGSQVELRTYK